MARGDTIGFGLRARMATTVALACGIAAGPLFLTVAVIQASLRTGFDPSRHSVSLLSLGPWGWIQVTNFVVCGLFTIAAAIGIRRVFEWATAGTLFIALGGLALVVAGIFVTGPAGGFPSTLEQSNADSSTLHGWVHTFAGLVAVPALGLAFISIASSFVRSNKRQVARGSRTCAVLCIVFGSPAIAVAMESPFAWFGWLVSWGWLMVVCSACLVVLRSKPS